jgi:hypothetical protein
MGRIKEGTPQACRRQRDAVDLPRLAGRSNRWRQEPDTDSEQTGHDAPLQQHGGAHVAASRGEYSD